MANESTSQDGSRSGDRANDDRRPGAGLGSRWSDEVSAVLSALSDPRASVPFERRGRAEVQTALHILDDVLSRLG